MVLSSLRHCRARPGNPWCVSATESALDGLERGESAWMPGSSPGMTAERTRRPLTRRTFGAATSPARGEVNHRSGEAERWVSQGLDPSCGLRPCADLCRASTRQEPTRHGFALPARSALIAPLSCREAPGMPPASRRHRSFRYPVSVSCLLPRFRQHEASFATVPNIPLIHDRFIDVVQIGAAFVETPANGLLGDAVAARLDSSPYPIDGRRHRRQTQIDERYCVSGSSPLRNLARVCQRGEGGLEHEACAGSSKLVDPFEHNSGGADVHLPMRWTMGSQLARNFVSVDEDQTLLHRRKVFTGEGRFASEYLPAMQQRLEGIHWRRSFCPRIPSPV